MPIDSHRALEAFDHFLMIMDDQLQWLADHAAIHRIALDGTLASLRPLEQLYDRMVPGLDDAECAALRVVFARYLGECVRAGHGGRWTLPLDDPNDLHFNRPVIVGHSGCKWLELDPISVMHAYALRPRAGMLAEIVEHSARPVILDLSDLAED